MKDRELHTIHSRYSLMGHGKYIRIEWDRKYMYQCSLWGKVLMIKKVHYYAFDIYFAHPSWLEITLRIF